MRIRLVGCGVLRRSVFSFTAATLLALLGVGVAGADESRDAKVAKALDQEIDVTLVGTPFERALEDLAREIKVNIVIDPQQARNLTGGPVTLRLDDAPARDALDLICMAVNAGWTVEQGVVLVTTSQEIRRRSP